MSSALHKPVKFAVVGVGHVGKRHIEMIEKNQEAKLVGICDVKSKEELGLKNNTIPFFSSIDELLASDMEIDVINICTPNGLHAEHALKSLEKKKNVVCEKPMALTKADCEAIIFKALKMQKNVFCVMQNRYSPPSLWVKDLIEKNILGEIYMVQLNCYWNRDERYYKKGSWKGTLELDGGVLFTQFSHFIDIMFWLFGDIKDIKARFENFTHQTNTNFEDTGVVNFNFVSGGIGCINYSTSVWNKNLESSITVIAEKGSIKVGGQYMDKVDYCHVENYEMPELPPVNPANDYDGYKGSASNHHYIIENVIDTLKERTTISTNALEGLKVVEIIEKIYKLRNLKKLQKAVSYV